MLLDFLYFLMYILFCLIWFLNIKFVLKKKPTRIGFFFPIILGYLGLIIWCYFLETTYNFRAQLIFILIFIGLGFIFFYDLSFFKTNDIFLYLIVHFSFIIGLFIFDNKIYLEIDFIIEYFNNTIIKLGVILLIGLVVFGCYKLFLGSVKDFYLKNEFNYENENIPNKNIFKYNIFKYIFIWYIFIFIIILGELIILKSMEDAIIAYIVINLILTIIMVILKVSMVLFNIKNTNKYYYFFKVIIFICIFLILILNCIIIYNYIMIYNDNQIFLDDRIDILENEILELHKEISTKYKILNKKL